jgi:hypothetical protein
MAEQLDLLAPAWEMEIGLRAPAVARRDLHLRVSVTAIGPTDQIDRETVPVIDRTDPAMDQAIGPTVRATGIDPIGPTIPITPVESGEAGIAPTGNTKITGTETGMFKTIFGTIGT